MSAMNPIIGKDNTGPKMYKVTIMMDTKFDPNKWVSDTLEECMEDDEKIVSVDCELIEEK